MTELIKVQNEGGKQTANARDIWEFLESKQEFANWIKDRISKYGFSEGQDFLIILSKSSGGRPSKEYHVSLEMAKELSMVENTDKGREARQYFIDCEKKLTDKKSEIGLIISETIKGILPLFQSLIESLLKKQ